MSSAPTPPAPTRPLTSAETGERLRFRTVHGGDRLRGRLAAMGLVPGALITVIRSSRKGPVIVDLKGNRILLGRGMAHRVEVD